MTPRTVEELKARVIARFPRASSVFSTIMDTDIDSWIKQLADVYPFWFLTISPGTPFKLGFPYATDPVPAIVGRWAGTGWLIANPGVAEYQFYAPLENSESTQSSWWVPAQVRMVDFIYEFDKQGQFLQSLPLPEEESALPFTTFKTDTRPQQATWYSDENASFLVLSPTPDKPYIYAIQYSISNPPTYIDDLSGVSPHRNRFLTFAPEAVLAKGMLEAAKFFDEKDKIAQYEMELFGAPGSEGMSNAGPVGGILGRLKKLTIKKSQAAREQMEAFRSKAMATGQYPSMSGNRARWNQRSYGSGRWW